VLWGVAEHYRALWDVTDVMESYVSDADSYGILQSFTERYGTCLQFFDAVGWVAGRASGL